MNLAGRPANGRNCFVVLRPCGHCISESGLKQLGGGECLVCDTPFDKVPKPRNSKPKVTRTQNPNQPKTPNPKPKALNPKSKTRNPEPRTHVLCNAICSNKNVVPSWI